MEDVKFAHEKLFVWLESKKLTLEVYQLVLHFPKEEKYILTAQIKRSAASVGHNLAEGAVRYTPKEKARFAEVAYGSLIETISQMELAKDLGYLSEEPYQQIRRDYYKLSVYIYRYREACLRKAK
ncbi:MAG: four helix bundle protein [Bacteroidetes bacterium]|nr:four helix bundle protein [Bacteroidota bacterium]MBR9920296.1 four helix bundle protein [Bacteroidota bacterium]